MGVDWEAAYATHARSIIRTALVIVGDDERARDVLQTTFETAYRKRIVFDSGRQIGPWLMGIAVREALKTARRERLRNFLPLHRAERVAADPSADSLAVWQAVATLPPAQRAAVALHYLHGYGIDEIAELLGVAPGYRRITPVQREANIAGGAR